MVPQTLIIQTQAVTFEIGGTVGEFVDIEQSHLWMVPTADELEQCKKFWISGPIDVEQPQDENCDY